MAILQILILGTAAFTTYSYLRFQQNRRSASGISLPTLLTPVFELNLLYYVLTSLPSFRRLIRLFPFLKHWTRYTRQSWRWDTKAELHDELGGVFTVVSPRKISLEIADYDVARQVLCNRGWFKKPTWMFELINIYGENVVTTEGSTWSRHRRFTSPAFGEKNNTAVWDETILQTLGLLKHWKSTTSTTSTTNNHNSPHLLPSPGDDFRKLALLVISAAGYRMHIPFTSSSKAKTAPKEKEEEQVTKQPVEPFDPNTPSKDTVLSYFTSIRIVSHRFVDILILRRLWPVSLRSLSILPASTRTALNAYHDLGHYLWKLIQYHQSIPSSNNPVERKPSLISALAQSPSQQPTVGTRQTLTTDEMLGNAFIFTLAGHETVAVNMEYAFLLLALYPEKQAWLHEQLDLALKDLPKDPREWDYGEVFPKLLGPFCVMNETLRLYPPVVIIPRETSDSTQSLTINGQLHHLPQNLLITVNTAAIHYDKKTWGSDAATFRPERWMRGDPNPLSEVDQGPVPGYPDAYVPPKGMFLAFSEGVRSCLGKKFAQVEFVVMMAVVMKDHVVELGRDDNEAAARKEALEVLEESYLDLTLMLPQSVPLKLRVRERSRV